MASSSVQYRYFVTDLLTNEVTTELPLTDVSYSKALKDAGEMSGKVAVGPDTSGLSLYANTLPGKSGLYVMRDGVCVWGGIIWSRDYDIVGKNLTISANEFTSYLHHRKIWKTWDLQHDGVLVYLDETPGTSQLYIELNADANDRVTLEKGTAVEIVFLDKKGYPYNGHYRVNKDYVNASLITVDKEPLMSTYPPVLSGKEAQTYVPGKYSVTDIISRTVSKGSSEVILTTDKDHGFSVGDAVNITKLDTGLTQETATTYTTRTKSYKIAAIADSTKITDRKGKVDKDAEHKDYITDIRTNGITVGATFIQDGSVGYPGIMPSIGIETTVLAVPTRSTGTASNGTLQMSRNATQTGELQGDFTNKKTGYSVTGTGRTVAGGRYPIMRFGFTIVKEDGWKGKVDVGDLITISGVKKAGSDSIAHPAFTDPGGAQKFHKITKINDNTGEIFFEIAGPSGEQMVLPTTGGEFSIVDTKVTDIAGGLSRTATCTNGKENLPVIKVINKRKFVVDASCADSPYDDAQTQTQAKVRWDRKYQATIHTHTDTYDQVRYLLGNVFEDFVHLNYTNPFLGNLEKYQVRTARYNTATDLATVTTGFIKPVFSKAIKIDSSDGKIVVELGLPSAYSQFITATENDSSNDINEEVFISGVDNSINGSFPIKTISSDKTSFTYNLPDTEQDATYKYATTATSDGTYTTYTTDGSHGLFVGQLVTVSDAVVSGFNKDNVAVFDVPSSTTFRVLSASSGTWTVGTRAKVWTSNRLRQKTYPSISDNKIVFGAHNLVIGSNIAITGLAQQNYDGSFSVSSIEDEVTLTYKPKFPSLQIKDVFTGKKRTVDNKYPITIYLSTKPNSRDYAYIPGTTKITVANMGAPYDGTWTINSQDLDSKTDPYIEYLVDTATPHGRRSATYADKKYGTSYTVSKAKYVATIDVDKNNAPTGDGVTTFTTTVAHPYVAGDTVAISNVGSSFTQKTGTDNAYSEIIVTVDGTGVPSTNTFTTNNRGLYGVNYRTDVAVGTANVSEFTASNASVRYYNSGDEDNLAVPPIVKIDALPTVSSPVKNKFNVTDRAFNKDDRKVYLQLSANPNLYKGGTIVVDGVDATGESVFDGTFTIESVSKWTDKKWQVTYYSTNKTYKKDFGKFKDATPNNKTKVRDLVAYDDNDGGTITQETWLYVGSYGSYPSSADIGIKFSTDSYSGHYMRSDRYKGHELKSVGEALSTYADKYLTRKGSTRKIRNVYGFDYRINCVFDYGTNTFKRIFTFIPVHFPNPPAHGEVSPVSRFGADKVVFEYPGNINTVSLKESSENSSTRFWMVGSDGGTGTQDATKTFVGVASKELLNKRWPLLEADESDDKLDYLIDISERAYRYLGETQPPTGEFNLDINGSLDPVVNTYQPGDWCSIIVNDPFVTERLRSDLEPRDSVIVRKITGYTVNVPNSPSFPEQVSLTLIPEWDVDKRG
jgi:hypothetical protein